MPFVQTFIAPRVRMVVLAAATAGAVFTLFTLVGVGAATGPLTSSFGTGESILDARYGGSERVAAPAPVAVRGDGRKTTRAQDPRRRAKPSTPLPGALRPPAAPPVDAGPPAGAAPAPASPAAPRVETPAVPVSEPPVPAVTAPTLPVLPVLPALPALPPVPAAPALPQVPELPQALTPAVPGVLP